jgi:hypothetical protein
LVVVVVLVVALPQMHQQLVDLVVVVKVLMIQLS